MLDVGYRLTRPLLFRMDPEDAHQRVLHLAAGWPRLLGLAAGSARGPRRPVQLAGCTLPSPVGLAAGLDKDGVALRLWAALGFGFVEVGTVTPRPQPGNPRPRIVRLPEHRGLVNWMGFPSSGVDAVASRLSADKEGGRWPEIPVAFNLGRNKDTPAEQASSDYAVGASRLRELADWFVVNVSSPNTPGLRALQQGDALREVVDATLEAAGGVPVFVKLSPDLAVEDLDLAIEAALAAGATGIVATNTTRQRPIDGAPDQGGLSGDPLRAIASKAVDRVLATVAKRAPVIGVGGISAPEHAQAYVSAGCAAVELYSGLVYEGPGLVGRVNRRLAESA